MLMMFINHIMMAMSVLCMVVRVHMWFGPFPAFVLMLMVFVMYMRVYMTEFGMCVPKVT